MKEVRSVDYLANERTFLAYIRTSLSVMAFGFIIARFRLFLELMSSRDAAGLSRAQPHTQGNGGEVLGVLFVVFGCLLAVLGTWSYWSTLIAIRESRYGPNAVLPTVIGICALLFGVALASVLLHVN